VKRMSKSTGNVIPIHTTAEDMYGKVMSVPDFAMGLYMRLVTRWSPAAISEHEEGLRSGLRHPRDLKMALAKEIVSIFYGDGAAEAAEASFKSVFQKGELPDLMDEIAVSGEPAIVDFLVQHKLASSKSEARRLIDQHGVKVNGQTVEDVSARLSAGPGAVVQVGKRRFVKIIAG
jgi:tyrosyl-tRNA synthetase